MPEDRAREPQPQPAETVPEGRDTPPQEGSAATAQELAAVRAQLEELERERGQYKSLAQRVQADFINYRRRVDEERQEVVQQATSRFVGKLLPVMDEFALAVEHARRTGAEPSWLEGVELIYRKLQDILDSEGVQRIAPQGQRFDPWEHEALLYQETAEHEEGRILAVVREGYKLYGRVLRPAQVVVARAPSAPEAATPEAPAEAPQEGPPPQAPPQG